MGEFTFKLPDIGEGVVEAEITAWHVSVGDRVEEDAPLGDAMTDKATIELTSPVEGVVKSLGCEEGDMFAVGGALVILETEGEVETGAEGDIEDTLTDDDRLSEEKSQDGGQFIFKLPDIGEGVVEAEITAWHVNVGDEVEEDDPLADAMTDKATIELTSPVKGVVQTLGCEEGDSFAVGGELVILKIEGGTSQPIPSGETKTPAPQKPTPQKQAAAQTNQTVSKSVSGVQNLFPEP